MGAVYFILSWLFLIVIAELLASMITGRSMIIGWIRGILESKDHR